MFVSLTSARAASVVGPLAVALGGDSSQSHLLSVIVDLMKDEFHDVRLK